MCAAWCVACRDVMWCVVMSCGVVLCVVWCCVCCLVCVVMLLQVLEPLVPGSAKLLKQMEIEMQEDQLLFGATQHCTHHCTIPLYHTIVHMRCDPYQGPAMYHTTVKAHYSSVKLPTQHVQYRHLMVQAKTFVASITSCRSTWRSARVKRCAHSFQPCSSDSFCLSRAMLAMREGFN